MKIFHISHTDLDGYGCQLITKEFFKDVQYFNANYGLEVQLSISKVLKEIENFKDEETLFLITDLNLTMSESRDLDNAIKKLKESGYNIKLQLLDHHGTGQKCADKYEWYFLDTKRSATKITYDYIFEEFEGFSCEVSSWLKPLVDSINAIDIWLEHEVKNFEFGKVCMSMVIKANEINATLFADLNREYRLHLLRKASELIHEESANIKLDESIYFLKRDYLNTKDGINTLDNISANFLVESLESKKEELTVMYKGHKGLLTYTLGSISIPANAFLKANRDFDFFIDVGRRGSASFRADGKVDVSIVAQKLANGGGHPNASGAKFDDFKDTIYYEDVKKFIQTKLDNLA